MQEKSQVHLTGSDGLQVQASPLPNAAPKTKYLPRKLDRADVVFGGNAMQLLPPMKDIPREFDGGSNPWVEWQQQWFFHGLDRYPVPREGIDLKLAIANLKCIQSSWEPKHEHKQAGVAYLASLWFSSPDGEPVKSATPIKE